MAKLSLKAQIEELKFIFGISSKKLNEMAARRMIKQSEVDLHHSRQRAILRTFDLFQQHEEKIRSLIELESSS